MFIRFDICLSICLIHLITCSHPHFDLFVVPWPCRGPGTLTGSLIFSPFITSNKHDLYPATTTTSTTVASFSRGAHQPRHSPTLPASVAMLYIAFVDHAIYHVFSFFSVHRQRQACSLSSDKCDIHRLRFHWRLSRCVPNFSRGALRQPQHPPGFTLAFRVDRAIGG